MWLDIVTFSMGTLLCMPRSGRYLKAHVKMLAQRSKGRYCELAFLLGYPLYRLCKGGFIEVVDSIFESWRL